MVFFTRPLLLPPITADVERKSVETKKKKNFQCPSPTNRIGRLWSRLPVSLSAVKPAQMSFAFLDLHRKGNKTKMMRVLSSRAHGAGCCGCYFGLVVMMCNSLNALIVGRYGWRMRISFFSWAQETKFREKTQSRTGDHIALEKTNLNRWETFYFIALVPSYFIRLFVFFFLQ